MKKEIRKFDLSDFPHDLIYLKLTKEFWRDLLNLFQTHLSLPSLSGLVENISVKKNNLFSDNVPFIRLAKLDHLMGLLEKKGIKRPTISEVEKRIVALKGYGSSGILLNPNLPVYEDEHLVRIIVHMIGDGTLTEEYGTTKSPHYTNGNAFLRNQFLRTLKEVFGDVSDCSRCYYDRSGKSRSYVAFAKWIGYLLRHWYPDARFDEVSGSLPSAFFQLPFELKVEMVRTFGDEDPHVGAHCIRFTSGGATILEQIRGLIVELMEATLPANSYEELLQSVGVVKACRSWFILDVYRPVFGWYAEHIGFTHPERAERLQFQLACDAVWGVRGLDGFDLDLLVIVGLREVGSVADVARRFKVREDFLFKVFQRLQKLGWIEGVEKQKFTTVFRTTSAGELFLERTLNRMWDLGDRVVVRNTWWQRLRDGLMDRFGSAAAVARRVGMPETTVRGYLQGRRQWMHARWVVALAQAVGWGREQVSAGIVVAFERELAPRYEQCDFLAKDLGGYRRFWAGEIRFDAWLEGRQIAVVREAQLLDVGFAEKLQSAGAIRERIIALAKAAGGEISLGVLKADGVLQTLVADRYPAYVADRMAKLVNQGVFVRIAKGRYRIFWKELLDHLRIQ